MTTRTPTLRHLEAKLAAYWKIIEKPLTLHEPTYREAVANFNALNLLYAIRTGREYMPHG